MRLAVLLAILAVFLGKGGGICVMDNKKGWNVQCGIRDSYLFRLKDIGGLKANFDFGFGLGDEEGFSESIKNTAGGYYKRSDDEETEFASERKIEERRPVLSHPNFRGGNRRRDNSRPQAKRQAKRPALSKENQSAARRDSNEGLSVEHRSRDPQRRRARPRVPSFGLLPPPPIRRETNEVGVNSPQGFSDPQTQTFFVRPGTSPKIVINQVPPRTPAPRGSQPTVGPAVGDLLKVDARTPADTDHVPSFAAKMFIVREAPSAFNPPGYKAPVVFPKINKQVEVPRTKFFCEEQKYLPGLYADVQLGCKVFHLCMPAAMGNTLTSFMCPNMTLFDQSIMQCNYWYHVNCETSPSNYDANLHMALSYRRMNAAQLPLTAVRNFDNVALLSHNSEEMKNLRFVPPADPSIAENFAFRRIGQADKNGAQERAYVLPTGDGIRRQPRKLSIPEKDSKKEVTAVDDEEENVKSKVKRSVDTLLLLKKLSKS